MKIVGFFIVFLLVFEFVCHKLVSLNGIEYCSAIYQTNNASMEILLIRFFLLKFENIAKYHIIHIKNKIGYRDFVYILMKIKIEIKLFLRFIATHL